MTEKHTRNEFQVGLWFPPLYPSLPGVNSTSTLQFVVLPRRDPFSLRSLLFSCFGPLLQLTTLWCREETRLHHRKMRPQLLNSSPRWFVTLFLLWTFSIVCCNSGGAGSGLDELWGSPLISRGGGRGGGAAGGGSSGWGSPGIPTSKTGGGFLWVYGRQSDPKLVSVEESSWLVKVTWWSESKSSLRLLVWSENNEYKLQINQYGVFVLRSNQRGGWSRNL